MLLELSIKQTTHEVIVRRSSYLMHYVLAILQFGAKTTVVTLSCKIFPHACMKYMDLSINICMQ